MDDKAGSLIRNERDILKLLFCEAYQAWIKEARALIYFEQTRIYVPVGTYNLIDRAWNNYVSVRDRWLSAKWI